MQDKFNNNVYITSEINTIQFSFPEAWFWTDKTDSFIKLCRGILQPLTIQVYIPRGLPGFDRWQVLIHGLAERDEWGGGVKKRHNKI